MEHLTFTDIELIVLLKAYLIENNFYGFMTLVIDHAEQIAGFYPEQILELANLFHEYLLSHPEAFEFYSSFDLIGYSLEELKKTLPIDVFFNFIIRSKFTSIYLGS